MSVGGVLAHGVGSRGTLPLPLWQFAWAAGAALILSFIALGALWREPRLTGAAGRAVGGTRGAVRALTWVARAVGLLLFGLVGGAALFGVDNDDLNIAPVTIYVVLWVGVPVSSALFGDVWRAFNPFRTISPMFPAETGHPPPPHHWWATATLAAFLFLELVHPSGSSPRILGWAMLVYAALMITGMWRFGQGWLDSADGFGVLFGLIGALSPMCVDESGSLRLRLPLSGLARADVRVGTSALILVVLGGTSFDGFGGSPLFTDIVGRSTGWSSVPANLIGLAAMILMAAILYWLGARTIADVTGIGHDQAAERFAPSLVPIVLGYAIAHYAQLLVDEIQTFWFRLSNPYGRVEADGSPATDLFGAADGAVDLSVIDADTVAWIQALAIVLGHVAGVVYAHELAVRHFEPRHAARSQQTMLVVMVIYSIAGLWLLFSS